MKQHITTPLLASCILSACLFLCLSFAPQAQSGYLLEHEADIAKEEPGTHNGSGTTTGYSFFGSAPNSKLVFRKRALHPGASIGYHLQKAEEIYYVVSGTGMMKMNNEEFAVSAGDAILTYAGSRHSLRQTGTEDLVIIINYEKEN